MWKRTDSAHQNSEFSLHEVENILQLYIPRSLMRQFCQSEISKIECSSMVSLKSVYSLCMLNSSTAFLK